MNNNTARHHSVTATTAAAVLATVALAGCSFTRAAGPPADTAESVPVTVAHAVMRDLITTIESGGVVEARSTATITARLLAPVREVRVSPGQHVRKGQTLIVLDCEDLVAAARAARAAAIAAEQSEKAAGSELQAAEAAVVLARASHARVAGLQSKRSATDQEVDEATAALQSAEARLAGASARRVEAAAAVEGARAAGDQANATRSFGVITAPFDGTVTEKMVEPGNMASPGAALLRLEDAREFRLVVRVDESRVAAIHDGDGVAVYLGDKALQVTGTVVEVSRAVDADTRAFLVKIRLPDAPDLRSGEFGRARFSGTPRRALTIPASAIVRHGQLASVFVVDNGRARMRLVNARDSEVVAGLVESEIVVVAPPAQLTDGRRVTVGGR